MNRLRLLLVVFACAGLFTTSAAADAGMNKESAKTGQEAKKKNSIKKRMIRTVVSVDASNNMIVVKKNKSAEETVMVKEGAPVMVNKQPINLQDLKPGTKVTLTYTMVDGKMLVTRITEKKYKKK